MTTSLDTDSRDVAQRLTQAWLAHPKGDFVIVIVRVARAARVATIRRVATRVVEVSGVADGPALTSLFDGKTPELAAAIVAVSTCGSRPPALIFSIDDGRPIPVTLN